MERVSLHPAHGHGLVLAVRHDRTILGYHGCDAVVAAHLVAGDAFVPSANDYDWLGRGIYFWEHGPDRALRFAEEQRARGKVGHPAVVGAHIRLGTCFDLLDTRFMDDLADGYAIWARALHLRGVLLPRNTGRAPDYKLRRLDCAVLNWYLDRVAERGVVYDTVRCAFIEGAPVYPGSAIHRETHVQVVVRTPACVSGVFQHTVNR